MYRQVTFFSGKVRETHPHTKAMKARIDSREGRARYGRRLGIVESVFGNLHTQSNDSDGGGAIGSCTSSQPAQSGQFGPNDGFVYATDTFGEFKIDRLPPNTAVWLRA